MIDYDIFMYYVLKKPNKPVLLEAILLVSHINNLLLKSKRCAEITR